MLKQLINIALIERTHFPVDCSLAWLRHVEF